MFLQDLILSVIAIISPLFLFNEAVPQHDSILTGELYYNELISTLNEARFLNAARMDKPTFFRLLSYLKTTGMLKDSLSICAGQKVMIFIHALVGHSNRESAERWQHSGSSISTVIHEVVEAMYECTDIFFIRPSPLDPVPAEIINNYRFYPYFEQCIGAIDGTHIPAVIPLNLQGPFRNRKGFISQNVLAAVNFDLTFSYALVGWEGSAHDSTVLDDARLKGLPLLNNKFYLADAGYALSRNVLTPFRGVRYHLKEFGGGNLRPHNKYELFNLRHSTKRNAVERILGVTKNRFPLLRNMRSYNISFEGQLIMCCFMLHNIVQLNHLYEDDFYADYDRAHEDEMRPLQAEENALNYAALNNWKEQIAQDMWNDYIRAIGRHE